MSEHNILIYYLKNKDVISGFDMSDGINRVIAIETLANGDAVQFVNTCILQLLSEYTNSEQWQSMHENITLLYNPVICYSFRHFPPPIESNKLLQLRLSKDVQSILANNELYKNNESDKDLMYGLIKWNALVDATTAQQVHMNKLLPSMELLQHLEKNFADNSLFTKDEQEVLAEREKLKLEQENVCSHCHL